MPPINQRTKERKAMTKTALIYSIVLSAAFVFASQATFAQAPICLLGVAVGGGPCPQANVDAGNRRVDITDSRAAEIYQAIQEHHRYLLVLQRYSESGKMCEERAWVGGTYAGGPSHIVVQVGTARKVCFDPAKPVWTAQQVNTVERFKDSWSTSLYQWAKYEENCVAYINQYRANSQAVAYGQSEIKRAQAWQDYYRKMISTSQNAVDQVAP